MDAFIRVQKSGSTSLQHSIWKSPTVKLIQHSYTFDIGNIMTGLPGRTHGFPTFNRNEFDKLYTLVRNPFEILVSYYYHTHTNSNMIDGWCNCNKVHGFTSWRHFLDSYLDPIFDWHLPPMKKSMYSFAYDINDNLIIDDYFKIEESNKLEKFIKYHGGIPLEFRNKTKNKPKRSLTDFYTDDDVDRLKELWKRDLNYFEYDFSK
jgi:hypothetical protein